MIQEEDINAFLAHYGVKGMRWGVQSTPGVSGKTNRLASKDAQEFARAKMFYGDGAGTRRKLIQNTVDARKSKDPTYAKAFDAHLARQDMSVHASKARSERGRTDRKVKFKQRTGFLARKVTGEMGTQAAFTAVIVGGVAFVNSDKGRSLMTKTVSKIQHSQKSRKAAKYVADFLKSQA